MAGMSTTAPSYTLRPAEPGDVGAIVGLIQELAEFENLSHLLEITPEKLHPHLFGPRPVVEALVGEIEGEAVGFALFFTNFSTFLASPAFIWKTSMCGPRTAAAAWVAPC